MSIDAQGRLSPELVSGHEQVRIIPTHSHDLVQIVDATGAIRFQNAAFQRVLGYADRVGASVFELVHPDDIVRVKSLFQQLVANPPVGLIQTAELRVRHADGHWCWLDITGANMLDLPAVAGVVLNGRDITERKKMEQHLNEIINREQDGFSRDLYDGLGQELTGIGLMAKGLASRFQREYPPAVANLEEIVQLVNRAVVKSRDLALGLSPVRADRGGLVSALHRLAEQATKNYGRPVRFTRKLSGDLTLPEPAASQLYRIAQEALVNAMRHAKPRRASIHLRVRNNEVQLSICDDGCGLPPNVDKLSGAGLRIMEYRARAIEGFIVFERPPNGGTRVRVRCRQHDSNAA